ncbi:MAG TPA: aminotransferase class V-fold PLP-dependent enzyme [Thermoanaerobaculia bacterium]|nr:aminotransferase class V-fold PLP-dependent enzyme [Thermoanaerobaculia bacterium]
MNGQDPLLAYRDHFPILDSTTYLISNSLGAMPREAAAGLARYAELWATRGVRAWAEEWWDLGTRVADTVAPLLGAPPGSVSMQPSTTLATAVVLSAVRPTGERRKVVTTDLHFPSILYLLEGWCREHGAALEMVRREAGTWGVSTQRLLEAIDRSTAVVALSHVEFATAWIHDAAALARRCRETGAFLVLDVFQSAGVVPVALHDWGVDAAVGGCLKWLCGGPGNVFLYVDPDRAFELEPAITGWAAHPAPFAFEPPPMRWRPDAGRFLNGTPQVSALYAAAPGLEILRQIGIERVRAKSARLTQRLFDQARRRGFACSCAATAERRGGAVAIDAPQGEGVARELLARDIVVDYRPGFGIRVAPHFYNSWEECERCLDAIEEILATRSFERHASVDGASPT